MNTLLDEDKRVIKVIKSIAYAAAATAIAIGIKSWFSEHPLHSAALFGFAMVMILNVMVFDRTQNSGNFRSIFLWLVGALCLYLIASGGESNTGILWFYVFPPFVFYIIGLRKGWVMMGIMAILIFIVFRFPDLPVIRATYPTDFQLRFAASISFVTVFSFVMDYSRRQAREELISMARLYEQAARTDELTQLPNRRDMQQHLEKEYFRYKRHGSYFSIILLDIDHFKNINDTYGHDAGDYVLVEFAHLLRESCRKVDTAARWGGEESLVLLPDTSMVQALATAERFRKRVEAAALTYKGQKISFTTSCGVCSISQTKELGSMLKQADINLYQAKLKGRNLVIPMVVQKPENTPINTA
ncbi:GGDEF domain-containing protein [Hahella ganghwensis]|uniref:GGDEF domain-containing protein n=1 Tax=Hahella ganghwensis TaxID=286420 RepID=UPI00036BF58B|nr:GGDEF domain-containing protein [Hahella ganghwensis]